MTKKIREYLLTWWRDIQQDGDAYNLYWWPSGNPTPNRNLRVALEFLEDGFMRFMFPYGETLSDHEFARLMKVRTMWRKACEKKKLQSAQSTPSKSQDESCLSDSQTDSPVASSTMDLTCSQDESLPYLPDGAETSGNRLASEE
jgi:hypothetical protein